MKTWFLLLLFPIYLSAGISNPSTILQPAVKTVNKPDITLWGYQGWHPVNDYNNMNVIDDYNNVNPRHAATVYLPSFVTVGAINTMYLRAEAIIEIDGAKVGTINMSGAGRLKISSGKVTRVNAKDYSRVAFYGGSIDNVSIIQGAKLVIFGHKFTLADVSLVGKWTDGNDFSIQFIDNTSNLTLIYSIGNITGDFNNDGLINFKDFALAGNGNELFIITKNWLKKF